VGKNRTVWQKLAGAVLWECRKRYYALRYPAAVYLAALLLICALPQELCRFLDQEARFLVTMLNLAFAISAILGLAILPYSVMSAPYGREQYQKERLSDISVPVRLFARALAVLLQTAFVLTAVYAATWGMGRFADASHSYFVLSLDRKLWESLLLYGILNPLIYLALFLRMYLRHQRCYYVFPYLVADVLTHLIASNADRLPRTLPTSWSAAADGVWAAAVLFFGVLSFWVCCRYEKRL